MTPDILIFPVEWRLTKKHRIILATLVYSRLEITTTETLFDAAYGDQAIDDQPTTRAVYVLISQVRSRIPRWIKIVNVPSIGYTIHRDIRKRLIGECNRAVEELRTMLDTMPLAKLQKLRAES